MALFTLNGMDEQLLRRDLLEKGKTLEEIQNLPLSFWKRMCRRIIDRPKVIAPRVDAVVQVSVCVPNISLSLLGNAPVWSCQGIARWTKIYPACRPLLCLTCFRLTSASPEA